MQGSKQGCTIVAMALVGLGLALIGIFAGVVEGSKKQDEAHFIEQLPELDAPGVRESISGTRVAATGVLGDPYKAARDGGFLIFQDQRWKVEYDEEDGWEGSWEPIRTVIPNCRIVMQGGTIEVYLVRSVELNNPGFEDRVYVPEGNVEEAAGISEGTVRRVGFRVGNSVTIVGTKTKEGIQPERIAGGDRADLIDYLNNEAAGLRLAGTIFGLVGLGLMGFSMVLWLRR